MSTPDQMPESEPAETSGGNRAARRDARKSVTENPGQSRQQALWIGGGAVVVVALSIMMFMKPSSAPPPASHNDKPTITEKPDVPQPLASDPPAVAEPSAASAPTSTASDAQAQLAALLAERQRTLDQREAQLRAAERAMGDARRKSDVFSEEPKQSGDDEGIPPTPPKRHETQAIGDGARLDDVRDDAARGRPGADANSSFAREVEAEGLSVRRASRMTRLECKILPGRILEGELQPRVISDLPGLITIMLTRDTYGEKGRIPLMPWGTRITGRPNPVVRAGQERNFIQGAMAFLPDGQYVQIDSGVADQLGSAGLDSEVDRHFGQILGMSAVLSLLGAGAANIGVSQSGQYNSGAQYRSNVQSSLAQSAQQQLNGYANIPPTLKNEQGTKVRIMVEKVLDFGEHCTTGREG